LALAVYGQMSAAGIFLKQITLLVVQGVCHAFFYQKMAVKARFWMTF
jgi:hypothetical protein